MSASPPHDRLDRRTVLILTGIVVLAAAIRLLQLGRLSLWTDEYWTLEAIRLPYGELIRHRMSQGHFPNYFMLVKAWVDLFGEHEWTLRFPSMVANLATLAFIFTFARRAFGLHAALWAMLFFALHQRSLWAAQEARPPAFVILAGMASLDVLDRALRRTARSWGTAGLWALYALISLLGLTLQGTYVFVFLSQLLVVGLWLIARRRMRWDWLASVVVLGLLGAGAYSQLSSEQSNAEGFFLEPEPFETKIYWRAPMELFWGEFRLTFGSDVREVGVIFIGLLIWLAARAVRRRRAEAERRAGYPFVPAPPPALALAVGWAFAVFVGLNIVALVHGNMGNSLRYNAVGLGGAVLVLGAALTAPMPPRARQVLAAVCIAIHLAVVAGWFVEPGYQIREAIRHVEAERRPGDRAFICKGGHPGAIASFYGLGIELAGISRHYRDPEVVRAELDRTVGGAPAFWAILYSYKGSPIVEVLAEWTARHGYERVHRQEWARIRTERYVRREAPPPR